MSDSNSQSFIFKNKLDWEDFKEIINSNPKEAKVIILDKEDIPELVNPVNIIFILVPDMSKNRIYWIFEGIDLVFDVDYDFFNSMITIDEYDYFVPVVKHTVQQMRYLQQIFKQHKDPFTKFPQLYEYYNIFAKTKKLFDYSLEKNNG